MSGRIFVIADTHFGHSKVLEFEPVARSFASIEEHDHELVKRWNATVTTKDTVWHLGDVFFGKNAHHILSELNGYKKLVMGNHDGYPSEVYARYFSQIRGAVRLGEAMLTHIPIHLNEMKYRFKYNVHGHLHSGFIPDDRYKCVSVEHTGLRPILLQEALERKITW